MVSALAVVVCAALGSFPGALNAQLFVTRSRPPADLQAFVSRADAIAIVEAIGPCDAIDDRQSHCPFELIDTVKDDGRLPKVGEPLTVHRIGTISNPERGFEKRFLHGERYLLALEWAPVLRIHSIAYGADGALQVRNGKLNPLGRSALSLGLMDRTLEAVVGEIRAAAEK